MRLLWLCRSRRWTAQPATTKNRTLRNAGQIPLAVCSCSCSWCASRLFTPTDRLLQVIVVAFIWYLLSCPSLVGPPNTQHSQHPQRTHASNEASVVWSGSTAVPVYRRQSVAHYSILPTTTTATVSRRAASTTVVDCLLSTAVSAPREVLQRERRPVCLPVGLSSA